MPADPRSDRTGPATPEATGDGALSTQLDEAVARIQRRVAERKASGQYPPGMEDELDRHYRALVTVLATEASAVRLLHEGVSELDALPPFSRARIPVDSRRRVGRLFHRVWAKLSSRQTEGVLTQVREHAAVVRRVLDRMAEVVEGLALHGHPDTERRVATLADRVALLEDIAERLDRIEDQLAELRRAEPDSAG